MRRGSGLFFGEIPCVVRPKKGGFGRYYPKNLAVPLISLQKSWEMCQSTPFEGRVMIPKFERNSTSASPNIYCSSTASRPTEAADRTTTIVPFDESETHLGGFPRKVLKKIQFERQQLHADPKRGTQRCSKPPKIWPDPKIVSKIVEKSPIDSFSQTVSDPKVSRNSHERLWK